MIYIHLEFWRMSLENTLIKIQNIVVTKPEEIDKYIWFASNHSI